MVHAGTSPGVTDLGVKGTPVLLSLPFTYLSRVTIMFSIVWKLSKDKNRGEVGHVQ